MPGLIDVLHNNVGIGVVGGAVDLAEDEWDRVLDTNLKSMFLTCKHVPPHMDRQGRGAIINVSSIASERATAAYPLLAYSASKGGVNALTRSMAMQYAANRRGTRGIGAGLRGARAAARPLPSPQGSARSRRPATGPARSGFPPAAAACSA